MLLFFILVGVSLVLFFLLYNYMATIYAARRKAIEGEFRKVTDTLRRMEQEKYALSTELSDLESNLTLAQHDMRPTPQPRPNPARAEVAEDKDQIRGSYLITNGLITVEQHAKAMSLKEKMRMDVVSVCLALGFIDQPTAKRVQKEAR
ncbi:MAG: hypothetical protein AB7D51_02200 [Desulfovibrionaceae bacterium]